MKTYGLIGYPLTHSFSKKYFTEKFASEGLTDHVYENFPLTSIEEVVQVFNNNPSLIGLNITIPYKEKIITYLDESTEVVRETGACNCIKIIGGKKVGYNTDVIGFGISLDAKLQSTHRKALILGTGGAAKAVAYALKQRSISYLFVSRSPNGKDVIGYDQIDHSILNEHTLVINTTPIGMYPNVDQAPPIPYQLLGADHYLFDLVYNPVKTLFLHKGEQAGAVIENGAAMLKIQANASWEIWNSND